MKKYGLLKNEKMGKYEKEKGFASYKTIIQYFAGNIVLCNNIINVDESIFYNMDCTETNDYGDIIYPDVYQYYVCNISEYEKEKLQAAGVILSYSDMLQCDIICVDHYGTSWDHVLTNIKLFDTYDDLKKYEEDQK